MGTGKKRSCYLFRIGGEAEGYQIGLYEDGPSADPNTHLFAWQKAGETGRLVYLGHFPANVTYDTYPGYCWERGGQEPVGHDGRSYREVLEQANRSIGSWMRVPGDGSIYTRQYMDIVQSEQMMVQWKLGGIRYNSLELQEQSRYEFWNVDDPYSSILLAPGPEGGTEPISKRPADIFEGLHATD